jgi:Ankyrin repeats (3 copies)
MNPATVPPMATPRRPAMLLSCLLLAIGACTKTRDDPRELSEFAKQGIAEPKTPQPQHSASASALGSQDKGPDHFRSSESKSGPSYLVVLASWKLNSEPATTPSPQSVKMADGFPRPANAQESTALRSGYGALLAGVCTDSASAERALAALRAEDFAAYLKETTLSLPANCPLPSRQWKLDHDLLLAAESDKPDAFAAARRLLDQGASPQGIGERSPLELAAYQNDVTLARLLLERGARPNRSNRAPQQASVLELALRTQLGDPSEMVKLLVKHGADVNAQTMGAEADPGSTVQLVAIRGCYPRLLAYLREKGAKPHPVPADEICRDRLPSEAVKAELSAILEIGGEASR